MRDAETSRGRHSLVHCLNVRLLGRMATAGRNGPVYSATGADRGVRVSDAEARRIKLNQSAFVPSYDRRREEEL